MVYTIYVERRAGFNADARALYHDIRKNLSVESLTGVRVINRYFAEDIDAEVFSRAVYTVFAEPQSDIASESFHHSDSSRLLAVEYLPGQFDQRADSCEQCIQIIAGGDRPTIRSAKLYLFEGEITDDELSRIRGYIINPVESRETDLTVPDTLKLNYEIPSEVAVLDGFTEMDESEYDGFARRYGLAMDGGDVGFCQRYFRDVEKRDPTMTELRLIDSYWSDHCRHTTFHTVIDAVEIDDPVTAAAFEDYKKKRGEYYGDKPRSITLMDIATLGGKYLKRKGILKNLDESEEINACSVKIKVNVDGNDEDWLLMFKNETHNHPTEIEPFGGAATCLGGAIRDPLSGRAYVYQAMRVTGAGDPLVPVADTLKGKLPQSKLTVTAANGYSSYGNQIGLSTGGVYEIYHSGYVAKRLEIGAVVGAAPLENVVRERPVPGDIVILLGGRTGRDGCGGATGSSKAHTASSLSTCGAEVQKGNPPVERKIQRLFRDANVTRMIKRCNDFGAGGVSVAVGELADGLDIDLSRVPKKYDGLDGTELAISESQERMAVVVAADNADSFIAAANRENLEATVIANVKAEPRLTMTWNDKTIVDISREFLDSNGAKKYAEVKISALGEARLYDGLSDRLRESDPERFFVGLLSDLNIASQKGLSERFDSSIGAATVVMPFGGKYQLTAPQYMAAKIPVPHGETSTASVMAYGFNPYISEKSPYHGAYLAVVESLAKLTAAGINFRDAYLTFQEYFEKLRDDSTRWGKPFSALLGAFEAQTALGVAAIGGKDSMSGSFDELDVPPTLVSFAIAPHDAASLVTPELKAAGHYVCLLAPEYGDDMLPITASLVGVFDKIRSLAENGRLLSCYTIGFGGIAEAVTKIAMGNRIGVALAPRELSTLAEQHYGAFVFECETPPEGAEVIGCTIKEPRIELNNSIISLEGLISAWESKLEPVFPTIPKNVEPNALPAFSCDIRPKFTSAEKFARPRVVIPVFPGTNCELDSARAFERAGAIPEIYVLRNLSSDMLVDSTRELAALIDSAQIMMLPGGFSGGDEPDGSGKFITAVLRSPRIAEAVTRLINDRRGLMLGICNGFQALVKSGLLPYGEIRERMSPSDPTLTYNAIKRHQSMMVTTRIASVKSPWLSNCEVGQLHTIPISHGEGRFTAPRELLSLLAGSGRIVTQYCTPDGEPTMDARYNPNSSDLAIEGIISPDGRILGKMGHSERIGVNVARNIGGEHDQRLFEAGVKYYD